MSDSDSFGSDGCSWLQMASSSHCELSPPNDEEEEFQDDNSSTENQTWDPIALHDSMQFVHVPAIRAM